MTSRWLSFSSDTQLQHVAIAEIARPWMVLGTRFWQHCGTRSPWKAGKP
jgi:hypothetical protein